MKTYLFGSGIDVKVGVMGTAAGGGVGSRRGSAVEARRYPLVARASSATRRAG